MKKKIKLFLPTQIDVVLQAATKKNTLSLDNLVQPKNSSVNCFDFDQLATNKIFNISQIREVCIDYRLRFLDVKYFKGHIPNRAFEKIKSLEKQHNTSLEGFKIMAPSVLFRLKKTDDPLLFVPMGNDYFYLIHKWGNDLSAMRKLWAWPLKRIQNLIITVLILSGLVTLMIPTGLFTKSNDATAFWLLYFFVFKGLIAVVIFYGFALGKNFNPFIWNNKYNKT
jgi:hypothetical protein